MEPRSSAFRLTRPRRRPRDETESALEIGRAYRGDRQADAVEHHSARPAGASTLEEVIAELETTKVAERSGRAMDHEAEDAFERLRAAGYL